MAEADDRQTSQSNESEMNNNRQSHSQADTAPASRPGSSLLQDDVEEKATTAFQRELLTKIATLIESPKFNKQMMNEIMHSLNKASTPQEYHTRIHLKKNLDLEDEGPTAWPSKATTPVVLHKHPFNDDVVYQDMKYNEGTHCAPTLASVEQSVQTMSGMHSERTTFSCAHESSSGFVVLKHSPTISNDIYTEVKRKSAQINAQHAERDMLRLSVQTEHRTWFMIMLFVTIDTIALNGILRELMYTSILLFFRYSKSDDSMFSFLLPIVFVILYIATNGQDRSTTAHKR